MGDWEIHNAIDIYNANTNTWSKSTLIEYKGHAAGIAVGNFTYWAGGHTYHSIGNGLSHLVEIRDATSGSITSGTLFEGNAYFSASTIVLN